MKTGMQLKLRGLQLASEAHREALEYARESAYILALKQGEITSDDVVTPELSEQLGNACGAIFREKHWRCVGFRKSCRPSAHARIIRVWRLI